MVYLHHLKFFLWLKIVKMINFMLCILQVFKKVKKILSEESIILSGFEIFKSFHKN